MGTWLEGTWLMWFKSRMQESGLLVGSRGQTSDIAFTCDLHVFFVGVQETQEQISRLFEAGSPARPKPARSKISKSTARSIQPIDRVAARVLPQEMESDAP